MPRYKVLFSGAQQCFANSVSCCQLRRQLSHTTCICQTFLNMHLYWLMWHCKTYYVVAGARWKMCCCGSFKKKYPSTHDCCLCSFPTRLYGYYRRRWIWNMEHRVQRYYLWVICSWLLWLRVRIAFFCCLLWSRIWTWPIKLSCDSVTNLVNNYYPVLWKTADRIDCRWITVAKS